MALPETSGPEGTCTPVRDMIHFVLFSVRSSFGVVQRGSSMASRPSGSRLVAGPANLVFPSATSSIPSSLRRSGSKDHGAYAAARIRGLSTREKFPPVTSASSVSAAARFASAFVNFHIIGQAVNMVPPHTSNSASRTPSNLFRPVILSLCTSLQLTNSICHREDTNLHLQLFSAGARPIELR